MDGRARPSILSRMLNEVLHLERKEDLIGVCIDIEHMCWKNPGLARVVDQAAEQGDPYAVEILKEAARHTFSLGDAVVQQLHFAERPVFRVGAWGSAIVKSKLHFQFFKSCLRRNMTMLRCSLPGKMPRWERAGSPRRD